MRGNPSTDNMILLVDGVDQDEGTVTVEEEGGIAVAGYVRLERLPIIAVLVAVACSLGFLAVGFTVPMYTEMSSTSESPVVTESSRTLVAESGSWVVLLLVFPLLATVLVAIALLSGAHLSAIVAGWSVTGVVAVFNLLAMLTIGIFLVPTTIALVVACAGATVWYSASRSVERTAI